MTNCLNSNTYRYTTGTQGLRFRHDKPISSIKTRIAPPDALFFGCIEDKAASAAHHLDNFLASVNRPVFLAQVKRELEEKARLIQAEPWVAKDFQSLIDREGNIYQIDLPAGSRWGEETKEWQERCFKLFDSFLSNITDYFVRIQPNQANADNG